MSIGFSSVDLHTAVFLCIKPFAHKPLRLGMFVIPGQCRKSQSRLLTNTRSYSGPKSVTNWPQLEILTTDFYRPSLPAGKTPCPYSVLAVRDGSRRGPEVQSRWALRYVCHKRSRL